MENRNNNKGSFFKGIFFGILFSFLFFLLIIIGKIF